MRLMLWSLLALNGVAAALWLFGITVPGTSRPAAEPPALTARRLELLSELPSPPPRLGAQGEALSQPPEALSPQSTPLADATATPPAAAPDVPESADVGAVDTPAPAADDAVLAAAPVSPPVNGTEAPAAKKAPAPQPQPESKPEPTPVAAASPVATVAATPVAAQNPPAPGGESATAGDAPDRVACYRTAEFAPNAKERIEATLQKAGLTPTDLKSSVRPRWWVYWTGAPAAADHVEQLLKAAGVKDWYRVSSGRETTLSLGVYGQVEGARRRQQELAVKGIQATVAERYAAQARQRWLVRAPSAAVESARATLASGGVQLEACP